LKGLDGLPDSLREPGQIIIAALAPDVKRRSGLRKVCKGPVSPNFRRPVRRSEPASGHGDIDPKVIITDGLRSCRAAMNDLGNAWKQQIGRWGNNRCETSHLPFRRRERTMLRFRQLRTLQKYSSVHAALHNHFNRDRHRISRETYKAQRSAALAEWKTLPA
jgi:hypothetical protein